MLATVHWVHSRVATSASVATLCAWNILDFAHDARCARRSAGHLAPGAYRRVQQVRLRAVYVVLIPILVLVVRSVCDSPISFISKPRLQTLHARLRLQLVIHQDHLPQRSHTEHLQALCISGLYARAFIARQKNPGQTQCSSPCIKSLL